ncbi:MAG: hypothetical protein KGD57_09035 [Candidatus Lokiarchaeota archaeon]|nr:hypothetical protein [Candidatus Lokiarchaeota archaeon]
MKNNKSNNKEVKTERRSFINLLRIPAITGLIIGIFAAIFQILLVSVGGPEAPAPCPCLPPETIETDIDIGIISISSITFLISIVGIVGGGWIAAVRNKEFKIKKGSISHYILYLFGGVLVMIFVLIVGACPFRLGLRFAYGDLVALIAIFSIFGGVAIGTIIILKISKGRMK